MAECANVSRETRRLSGSGAPARFVGRWIGRTSFTDGTASTLGGGQAIVSGGKPGFFKCVSFALVITDLGDRDVAPINVVLDICTELPALTSDGSSLYRPLNRR
ncbi:MAG: hypothetical protein ACREM1_08765 [Longimicrobiales bacterium]